MTITKLLPTKWQATFGNISVNDETNMYTDVSSSTYSFVELIGLSVSGVKDFYLGGFEKNKIPAGSEITGYTVRIKIANSHGKVSTAGISLYGGARGSITDGAIIPGTTLTNVKPGTLTLPTDGVDWDVINSLVQSGNLYIHIPIQTLANNDGGIHVYGAEIEVTYELPEKYVTGRRLQRFWDNAKNYIDTEIPTNVSDLANDAGYLTQHQDISGKADKSEIPIVPTNVSAFTNDSGYINDLSPYIYYSQNSNTVYINSATEITDTDEVTTIEDEIGDLSQLTTTAKDDLVSAINEENEAITETNERLTQQAEMIDAIGDMGDYNIYVTNWTKGRRSTGALNDYYYSSGIIETPCKIYFDATNYKLSFVSCNADGSEHGYGATWKIESPVSIPVNATYGYCWLEIQHAVTQTSITDSELEEVKANTYYIVPIPIVETIKQALTSAYVDGVNGLDTNDGSSAHPYKTINNAVASGRNTIFVANGTYNEFVFIRNREKLTILPWSYGLSFDTTVPDTPKIEISGGENNTITCAIRAYDCGELTFVGIYGNHTQQSAFEIFRCKKVEMIDCWASDVSDTEWNGFKLSSCNGTFRNCRAWNIGRDGFGISIYGNTQFIDCVAHDCGDDGVSHHDGCTGAVIGGEYYNCAKGGVATPTYGAYIDVINVYSHDNRYGLYSVTDSSRRRSKARVSGCVFKNNTGKDIYINNNDIIGWGNIYDNKSLINQATFTEF